MRRIRSLGRIHVVFFHIFDSQALTTIASVSPVGEPTRALSSGLSSPVQLSDSGTPTTSSRSGTSSMSTKHHVIPQLPLAGPMVAGVLVGIVLTATVVVICFLQRQPKRRLGRHRSLEAQFILQPDSRQHRYPRSRFLCDEIPSENHPRKKKNRRYSRRSRRSRYSSGTIELEVQNPPLPEDGSRCETPLPSGNQHSTDSIFSLNLSTSKLDLDQPNYHVNGSRTSSTFVPSILSSNQADPHFPQPTIELPLQTLSSPSQNKITHAPPALLSEVERPPLNTLVQQRAALLASGNTSDQSVHRELLLLEAQIQILRRQEASLPQQDIPPPYNHEL